MQRPDSLLSYASLEKAKKSNGDATAETESDKIAVGFSYSTGGW